MRIMPKSGHYKKLQHINDLSEKLDKISRWYRHLAWQAGMPNKPEAVIDLTLACGMIAADQLNSIQSMMEFLHAADQHAESES